MNFTKEELKEIWNNEKVRLSIFPINNYTAETNTGLFNEFTYEDKPLLLTEKPSFMNTVYSLLVENNTEFNNTVNLQLKNDMIKDIVDVGDIRETSYYSQLLDSGFEFKDYMFRLYYDLGLEYVELYTGTISKITESKEVFNITLDSRLSLLRETDCIEVDNEYAGSAEYVRFGTALDIIFDGENVDFDGDIDTIDYAETEKEGTVDLRAMKNSYGVFNYSNEEVMISNKSKYDYGTQNKTFGTKYNFVSNTVQPFSIDDILHFSFKANDNKTYFVVEKQSDISKRIGQYTKLYLLEEGTSNYTSIPPGRISENLFMGDNDDVKVASLEGAYVEDLSLSDPNIEISWFGVPGRENYHYFGAGSFEGYLGQVVSQDGFFMPLFGYCKTFGDFTHDLQAGQPPK